MTDASWTELVETIAQNGRLVERLGREHVADDHDRCRICTVPGSRVHRAYPCTIASLARDAALLRRRWSS